jgi:putative nucleotidyltransferase with HDIG domain
MSTLGLTPKFLTKAAAAGSRIPRQLRTAISYLLGSVVLTALLIAHAVPFQMQRAVAIWLATIVGLSLAQFHLKHTSGKGVPLSVRERILWLTSILSVAGLQMGAHALAIEGTSQYGVAFLAIAPIVALGMLVSGLLGPVTAIFAVTLTVLGAAIAQVADPRMLAGAWLISAIAAHAVNPMRQRNDLFRATYVTTAAFAVVALSTALYDNTTVERVLLSVGWGAVGGIGATALFWLAVAAFERAFGLVSDWSLLEICSPDQPLLRDLVLKAPGTYAHSVLVGNLSEAAARNIGANALLCRAMAYYHDIGKTRRPEFFIENKRADNPHDKLAPSLSATIIGAHVKDGLELADKHKLPKPIREGIAQHHGTSLISYFYHMATKDSGVQDPILEQHFRYPGPRPRSKEAAILMLADRVEAATRTLSRQTPGRLRSFIWEIVQDVRDDGQLDDSELNFRDLQTIVRAFVGTISATTHERVEYPSGNVDANVEQTPDSDCEQDEEEGEGGQPPEGS